jgi:RNA polymerase sigma factor (TIGR02999 family)
MNEADRADGLMAGVYSDLRRCAARYLRREAPGHLLEPTALVNEALVRLMEGRSSAWHDRARLVGTASLVMRRILVDHARSRRAAKRGGTWCRVPLDDELLRAPSTNVDGLDLRAALADLEAEDPQQARVVTLRYLDGCSVEEAAEILGISPATVKRKWDLARAWLHGRLLRPGRGRKRGTHHAVRAQ